MKKILSLCCVAAAIIAGMTSCEESKTGYEGINYIYLSSESSSIYDQEDATMTVTVRLTTALSEDLTLDLVVDDTENLITLTGNPVTIAAGSTTATFEIKSATISETSKTFKITLSSATTLPENVQWSQDFTFTVNSSLVPELTDAQQAIVEAYKTATGIDLSKYIGLVNVTTEYTPGSPDGETALPKETISGITAITLSELSTAEKPVLKMTHNPMGLQDKFFNKLKESTITNPLWIDEYAYDSYPQVMEAVGWTETSDETFTMTLDSLVVNSDGTVDFVADKSYYDEYYEENVALNIVPFEYSFTAYDRELEALEKGEIGTAIDEYWSEDATFNPAYQLNCVDTTYETANEEFTTDGNWIEAKATISNEKLEFVFCVYHYVDYDYSRVVATYTPNE